MQHIQPFERVVDGLLALPVVAEHCGALVKGEATQIVKYNRQEYYQKHFDTKVRIVPSTGGYNQGR